MHKKPLFLIKIATSIQRMGRYLLSPVCPKIVSKECYYSTFKRKLNLKKPVYFNEKLMWLKLYKYANDPLVQLCVDKYKVREYVMKCGLGHILNDLYFTYDKAKKIEWSKLPNRFAIKCNHGCGYNLFCTDKSTFDTRSATKKLNKWMHSNSWRLFAEVQYRKTKKRIICEKYIEGKNGSLPVDYKFYCFSGVPIYIGNFIERNIEADSITRGYFDTNWVKSKYYKYDIDEHKFCKPKMLDQMLEYAKVLSAPFPFVRVDFYEIDEKVIFGEMTFTPTGCLGNYYTDSAYKELGDMIDLTKVVEKHE